MSWPITFISWHLSKTNFTDNNLYTTAIHMSVSVFIEPAPTAVQLVYNPLSQFVFQTTLYSQFSKNRTLGRFFHRVAMSVYIYIYICICPLPMGFFWGLSLALRSHDQFKASHWSTLLPPSVFNFLKITHNICIVLKYKKICRNIRPTLIYDTSSSFSFWQKTFHTIYYLYWLGLYCLVPK